MDEKELFNLNVKKAYQVSSKEGFFHYDPSLNFIFIPLDDFKTEEDFLIDIMHEIAHSKLSDTLFGFTLDVLLDIQSQAEKVVRASLVNVFSEGLPGDPRERLREFMIPFSVEPYKDNFDYSLEKLRFQFTEGMAVENKQQLVDALLNSNTRDRVNALRKIDKRRKKIINCWKTCQEGFALWVQIWEDKKKEKGGYPQLIDRFLPSYTPNDKQRIRGKIHEKIVSFENSLLENSGKLPKSYINTIIAFKEIEKNVGLEPITTIAMTLSHFPYQACDLLDISDEEFETWLNSPLLNSEHKIKVILENSNHIKKIYEQLVTKNFKNKDVESYLKIVYGSHIRKPLDSKAVHFHNWALNYLQDSNLCINAFNGLIKIKRIGTEVVEWLEEDDADTDMRYSSIYPNLPNQLPPMVTSDGEIYYTSRYGTDVFMETFNDYWKVRSTMEFLDYLENLLEFKFSKAG